MEIGKLAEKELRVMLVKMMQNLENRMDKMQTSFNTFNMDLKGIRINKPWWTTQIMKWKII